MRRPRHLLLALVALVFAATALHAAPARAAAPQKLFALDAKEGQLTPVSGKPGVFDLALERVRGRAIYFTDRPARKVGTVAVRRMLTQLFADDSPDPNAAVNATAPMRGPLLMGVELLAWNYEAKEGKLTLRVRHLPQGGQAIGEVRDDTVLPRSFRDVSLFIDNCCGVGAPATVYNTGQLPITMSINDGAQVSVPGSSFETRLPGSETIHFVTGPPTPGSLGIGSNHLLVLQAGMVEPLSFQVDLPPTAQYYSLQLYLFVGPNSVGWTALNQGTPIASGGGTF